MIEAITIKVDGRNDLPPIEVEHDGMPFPWVGIWQPHPDRDNDHLVELHVDAVPQLINALAEVYDRLKGYY